MRLNGFLALGVAARCVALLGATPLAVALDECRSALVSGTPDVAQARAAAALAVTQGAGAVLRGSHAERLSREALFLLVFGSRPAIRSALSRRLLY